MTDALARLWLCADVAHPNAGALVGRVSSVLAVTPAVVWLRSPRGWSARELLALGRALRDVTARARCPLFVGDRLDVAVLVGADGVHLPERGFAAASVRACASLRVSVAVHDARGIAEAAPHADALVLSPFGVVEGKGVPLGRDGFAALRSAAPGALFVALGGVTDVRDARAAVAAGADGVAVRRALLDAPDPAAACLEIAGALGPTDG